MKTQKIAIAALIPFMFFASSCEKKGPAEEMGEKIDEAAEEMKDAIENDGPLEETGEKIDEAVGK